MRLWSLHPAALDRQGLIASWREALLAQAVLLGRTRGYTRHPQLHRFREHPEPVQAIVAFLHGVREEAVVRATGSTPTASPNLLRAPPCGIDPSPIEVTAGQLDLEWQHLRAKIAARSRSGSKPPTPSWRDPSGPDASIRRRTPVHRGSGRLTDWERA
ncbi:pyrimidine dimer DNA glycosylase/endonuclease V [Nesterenkonia pannonica]|uniref:pyrimidine dimer DNA glycosylase/endonuclease V n=1 Tax=Nesterenkonia pannonica TaxID=1548602 RepID=UPI0021643DFB|nr:pyrimidine dimer DNA glycosylase/endonuclease V [Nesterenkonia pannonica]